MADIQVDRLHRRARRERKRREEAEQIAEESTRELYDRQRELEELASTLEERVEERTRQLEQRLAQQAQLAEISGRALAGMELDELLGEICTSTVDVLKTDYCQVFKLEPESNELVLQAGVGWPKEYFGSKTVDTAPDCQTGFTMQRREPVVVEDIREDPRFHGPGLLEEAGVRSGITVLIPGPEGPWGVFGVHARQPRAFDEDDATFIQSMGNVLGEAIQRKRSRQQLEAYADRLEEANDELEHFANLASHDLQEPVRMVRSYMDLLASRYGDELDEDAQEMIAHAKGGAERIHAMIEGLRRYSRIETQEVEQLPVDADEVLDEVLQSLAVQIAETDAEIECEDLPTVRADPAQLGQVFQNLISNALKFSEPGHPPQLTIRADRSSGSWRFSVEDEGVGMDPEQADELFQMFQQGPGNNGPGGHGIGLAVCKKIVQRHGGTIWVDTEPGAGSTFHFTLPATPSEQKEEP